MSIREEQCNKVCRILDDVLANRPTERDSLIVAVIKAFVALEVRENSELSPSVQPEIIRCKDCRHRIVNDHYGEKGYLNIKGYCELDTGDPFELGRNAENDDWFCADAERKDNG